MQVFNLLPIGARKKNFSFSGCVRTILRFRTFCIFYFFGKKKILIAGNINHRPFLPRLRNWYFFFIDAFPKWMYNSGRIIGQY